MLTRLARTAAVAALVGVGLAVPSSATAIGFHQYSVATESTGGSGFSGVKATRLDATITGLTNDGCSAPFSGSPIYQTEWILLGGSANWRELGTGHQCSGTYNYWFWGYGSSGAWHPIGTQLGVTLGQTHTFQINWSGTQNTWWFQVDNVTKGTMTSATLGTYVQAGLESYWSPANVIYSSSSLSYQKNGGLFNSWSGRDASGIGPQMCGVWISDTSWESGEGTPCL